MEAVGIDACGGLGWVAVRLVDGAYRQSLVEARLDVLVARVPDAVVVGVDIPLGLVESGWRAADLRARKRLGVRRGTVFLTAPRTVWEAADYREAGERCRAVNGKGLSRQTWALAERIREARVCWAAEPERLREVHPEVSFQAMAGGTVPDSPKKSWRGQALRRASLAAAGITLPDTLGEADRVPPDDVLDAAAAAWSAHRIATGRAGRLPEVPDGEAGEAGDGSARDREGREVAIWY